MKAKNDQDVEWFGVIGRALALLCLAEADLQDKDLATQAKFLEKLGLPKDEAATLLGTSAASLGVLLRRAKAKGKGGRKRGPKARK